MFARSTTIQAQSGSIDAGIAHLNDTVMPALQQIDGFVGLSLLCDRQSGRCIITTSWRDEEALRNSDAQVVDLRRRAVEMFGASDAKVDRWDIAVMHRAHRSQDGACVRTTWMKSDPASMDRTIATYRNLLSRMETLPGFCSASLMVDRDTGRSVATATYDSMDRMRDSRDGATQIRNEGMRTAESELSEVAEFELALAHLRVPELV